MIYFQYKKEYRSSDDAIFQWFKENLDQLSKVTAYLLLNQTDEKRKVIQQSAEMAYKAMKRAIDKKVSQNSSMYSVEHRLTDNYTRLLACYELVFGKDREFRQFIFQEVLSRFVTNRQSQRDNALLNEMFYLANAGRIKEYWHYHFNNNKRELYINLSQCYEAYRNSHRDHSLSMNQFRDILKTYFEQHGGYETGSPKWYGRYTDDNYKEHVINRTQHSYVLQYYQVGHPDNLIKELFPIPEEVQPVITSIWEQYKSVHKLESEPEDLKDEAPF